MASMAKNQKNQVSRNFDFSLKATKASGEIGKRSRHLKARILEYFCAKIMEEEDESGIMSFSFEGFLPSTIVTQLSKVGVQAVEGQYVTFYIREEHSHEDIDALYGLFMGILL